NRFASAPWTGIGLNQGKYQADSAGVVQAHNQLLQYLSDQGVFGGLLFVVLLVLWFVLVARLRPPAGVNGREVRIASFAFLVAVVMNGMVEPTLMGYSYGILLVYFLAWLRVAAQRADPAAAATTVPRAAVP